MPDPVDDPVDDHVSESDGAGLAVPAPSVGVAALAELRRSRQARRRAQVNRSDALYQAYVTAFVSSVIVLYLSTVVGDQPISPSGLERVVRDGPGVVGLLFAIALAIGLRSGARGGPVAVEPAEVRFVLLAPVARRRVLLGPALKQLRFAVFAAAVAGAAAGLLTHRRLGQTASGWIATGAAVAVLLAATLLGAALVANGLRLRQWLATIVAGGLLAWAVADLAGDATAPTSVAGRLAFAPLEFRALDLVAVGVILAMLGVGLLLLGRGSLEAAERRTVLVGQLRFAATLQDLRTVILLRRQLAQELPRQRPWVRIPGRGRFVLWRRGWHGLVRFPLARLGRVLLLTAGATAAVLGTVHGTKPLVVVAGFVAYVLGLDLVEPLAQEVDHDERAERLPVETGLLLVRHLPASAVAAVVCGALGAAGGLAVEGTEGRTIVVAIVLALSSSLGGLAGAVVSTVQGAPSASTTPSTTDQALPPEVAGMRIVIRAVWPVAVAVIGSFPGYLVADALAKGRDPLPAALQGAMLASLFVGGTAAWVRFREPARAWFRQAVEDSKANARQRQVDTAPTARRTR